MKLIMHEVKKFDFLGPTVNFTIKHEKNFKTVIGGLVSLIVYFLYLFFCVLFGRDLIYRLNPNVSVERILPEEPENYTISEDTFFAWRITDFNLKTFNTSIFFDVQLSYESFDNMQTKVSDFKEFDSVNCKNTPYEKFFNNSIYKAQDWNCFDFRQLQDYHLYGSWDANAYSYILFQMQICDMDYDNSLKFNCKDYKKVQEYLYRNSLFFTFLYYEVDFKASNYEEPLQKVFKTSFININLNFQKTKYLKFQNTVVEQDDDLILSNEYDLTSMHGIYPLQDFSYFRSNDDLGKIYSSSEQRTDQNVFSLFMFQDNAFFKYSRKYLKVQDVFGNVNGFMEFCIAIISLISIYTDYRLEFFLFNKMVDIRKKGEDKEYVNSHLKNYHFNHKFSFNFNNDLNYNNDLNFKKNEDKEHEFRCSDNKSHVDNNVKRNFSQLYGLNNSDKKINKSFNHTKKPSVALEKDISSLKFNSEKGCDVGIEKIELALANENYNSGSESPNRDYFFRNNQNENELHKVNDIVEIYGNNNGDANTICRQNGNFNINTENVNLKNLNSNVFVKKSTIEIHEIKEKNVFGKIDQLLAKKKRYMEPSFFYYFWILCCKLFGQYSKKAKKLKNKKYFDFKLLEVYNEKIMKKLDIFYYLRMIRNYKNLKRLVLENHTNEKVFDRLSKNYYVVRLGDAWDASLIKPKKYKMNLETLRANFEGVYESSNLKFQIYLFNKLNEIL